MINKKTDDPTIDILISLEPLKLKVYWVLNHLTSGTCSRFTVREITDFLIEKLGIATNYQAVTYALNSNKKAVHVIDGKYKLMQHGREQLLSNIDPPGLFMIEPGKPFSKKRETRNKIFKAMSGQISFCDPYCGPGILDLIYKSFRPKTVIRILTQQIIDKPTGSFPRSLSDLRDERFDVTIKLYKNSVLHDRYVIDDNHAWLSGYGFNDLGRKESFIVLLGKDIRQSLLSTFNSRWKVARDYKL